MRSLLYCLGYTILMPVTVILWLLAWLLMDLFLHVALIGIATVLSVGFATLLLSLPHGLYLTIAVSVIEAVLALWAMVSVALLYEDGDLNLPSLVDAWYGFTEAFGQLVAPRQRTSLFQL